ncbi:hypothetical protein HPG69_007569 [Diceros bicornis minor]|uniref:Uncharacterized protein n=1 Tax=Diceros bicornis minor TaxID=77932 RepID=A0A7J7ERK1_DICBM|nr:hypothetical protein HPG69_007569 [Diceros bicornis minor]
MSKEENEVVATGMPQGSAPITTTVINIRTETSVPDHIVWSLFNTVYMNCCCLGIVAFAYSVKVGDAPESVCEPAEVPQPRGHLGCGEALCSRDRKMVGDMTGAQSYASTAKLLNILALVLGILVIVIFIIVSAVKGQSR